MTRRDGLVAFAVVALAACATPTQRPSAPERASPPVVREPIPTPAIPVPAPSRPPTATTPAPGERAFVASEVPPGTLYVCVSNVAGKRQQIAIAFDAKVEALCRRHPEMGPCQYERNVCRRGGGRVFTAAGAEITVATEAEYDKKVMRVRFRGD